MPQAYNYKRITSTGATVVSISQMGMLHGVTLNQQSTAGATSTTNMIGIYDSTTTFAASSASGVIANVQANNSGVGDYIFDVLYANGLTIAVGSAVSPVDITVIYT